MKMATAVVGIVLALLGIGAALNSDLVLRRFPVDTGVKTVNAPLVLGLVLFAAASWILFLIATSLGQGILLKRLEDLSIALDGKDREVMRMKAAVFDESMETLRNVAARLDQRLRELEPMLAGHSGDSDCQAGVRESRAA